MTRLLTLGLAVGAVALAAGCSSGGAGQTAPPPTPPSAPVDSIVFSPDGAQLAASFGSVVKVFGSSDGAVRQTLTAPQRVPILCYSPDGKHLAGACDDKTVLIWDAGSWQVRHTLGGLKAPPTAVAWSPDGGLLVVAAGDPYPYADRRNNVRSEVRLFDPVAGKELAVLNEPGDTVTGVAFTPDGKRFITGGVDGAVRAWDAAARKPAGPSASHGPGAGVTDVAISPDGRTLVSAGEDNAVVVWDLPDLKQRARLEGLADRANAVTYTPRGPATAGEDGAVWVWDVEAKAPRHKLADRGARLYAVAASPDGNTLAAGGVGGVVRVWDVANPGQPRLELR